MAGDPTLHTRGQFSCTPGIRASPFTVAILGINNVKIDVHTGRTRLIRVRSIRISTAFKLSMFLIVHISCLVACVSYLTGTLHLIRNKIMKLCQ